MAVRRIMQRREAPSGNRLSRRGAFGPSSFDAATMTVEATISTFADVRRRDSAGPYVERLDPAGLDVSRLVGAPLLDGHRQNGSADVLGVVESVRREHGALVARIRLSGAADAANAVTRIQEGVLRGVSIGADVRRWVSSVVNGERVRTAAAWSIFEISAVPVPADPGSSFRTAQMEDETETRDVGNGADEMASPLVITQRADGAFNVSWRDGVEIDDVVEMLQARRLDQRNEIERQEIRRRSLNQPRIRTVAPQEDATVHLRAMEDALVRRMGVALPDDDARQFAARTFAGASLRDLARAALIRAGLRADTMNPDELFRAAVHTTSDFPALLTGAGQRTLLASYEAAASPLRTLARQGSRPDFRSGSAIRLGEVGRLEKVGEGGEIKQTSRAEAVESYALDTYASMFTLSRQAIINDDLGGFNDWARAAGHAAASTEGDLLWSLLSQGNGAGPVLRDGKRLFHADHGNLLTAAALSVEALSDARLALRQMKGLDGKTPISVDPKFLLVGPELETVAEKVLASIYAGTTGDVNPFSQRLTLLVEPRRTGRGWDVFADPAQVPVLEYSYLASAPGPQVSQRDGWDVLAREFRVFLDFGAGALDWRGVVRNPGA